MDPALNSLPDGTNEFGASYDKVIPKNQREKIVFAIDLDHSMDEYFMLGDKTNDTRIDRTKQLLKWFIEQKLCWNPTHEFAIMILGEIAVWHMDFTSDKLLLSHAIDELYSMGKFKSFDSTSLFKEILEHGDLDQDDGSTIRLILIYTRSDTVPSIPEPEVQEVLAASGRFFYDCVYIHQKAAEVPGPNKPQHVYDRLTEMEDARSPGYYYELTRVLKKYCVAMAELLTHPSIRPVQDSMCFKMKPPPVRRADEPLQQQQSQSLLRQQHTAPQPRRDLAVTYRSSDNMQGGAGLTSGSFYNATSTPPRPTRTSSSGQITSINMTPAHSASPFTSQSERSSSSRSKLDSTSSGPPSRQDSFSTTGNSPAQSSGTGAAMDDAILI